MIWPLPKVIFHISLKDGGDVRAGRIPSELEPRHYCEDFLCEEDVLCFEKLIIEGSSFTCC